MTDVAADAAVGTDRLVRVFLKIRARRALLSAQYKKDDEALKSSLKTVEIELLRRALDQGVEGFACPQGTTYIAEEMHTSIADDELFYNFIRETGDLEFFERRVTVKHVREYMQENDGALPPGLNVFRENCMRVRAKQSKGGKSASTDDAE